MVTEDALHRFLIYLTAAGRSAKTIRAYEERLRRFFRSLDKVDLDAIVADDLDEYVLTLRQSLSSASTADHIQAIKAFFRWCTQRGYIETSPATHLKKPRLDFSARNKAINDADFRAMLSTAQKEGRKLEVAILLFLLDTGCRAGELCSLDLEDIDLERNEAQVRGKTGSRILDFTEPTAKALKEWFAERHNRKSDDPCAVFVGDNGRRLTIHGLYGRLRTLAKRAGVRGRFNPHAFRHRVGQGWIDQGANLEIVRLKLGHRDIHTTSMFYANQDRERQKRATERYSLVKG